MVKDLVIEQVIQWHQLIDQDMSHLITREPLLYNALVLHLAEILSDPQCTVLTIIFNSHFLLQDR